MLHQLHRGLVRNQIFLRESDEDRASGFMLLRAGRRQSIWIDIAQRDRRFGGIKIQVASRGEQNLSVLSQQLDRLPIPEKLERAG